MNILFLGDVVGTVGCDTVRQKLPELKAQYQIDLTIVNGENSAEGNGILPASADHLFDSGADVITLGNHALRRREIYERLEEGNGIIRPANFHSSTPGEGCYVADFLRYQVCVINLQGVVYMDHHSANPFDVIDQLLEQHKEKIIVVDFHAEATAEKLSLAHYLDGRVSVVAGTHTHVQTADETIFPGGTGYITDLGMCGPVHSVLGVKPELAVKKLRTNLPVRFENAPGPGVLSGAVFSINEKTGKTTKVLRIFLK